jgi:flagellar hook-basal body complex protein FliE
VSVAPVALPEPVRLAAVEPTARGRELAEPFGQALSEARALETKATAAAEQFAAGDPSVGIHEVMIATEKASIALRYATTLKNKAVDAYRELMNTPV